MRQTARSRKIAWVFARAKTFAHPKFRTCQNFSMSQILHMLKHLHVPNFEPRSKTTHVPKILHNYKLTSHKSFARPKFSIHQQFCTIQMFAHTKNLATDEPKQTNGSNLLNFDQFSKGCNKKSY